MGPGNKDEKCITRSLQRHKQEAKAAARVQLLSRPPSPYTVDRGAVDVKRWAGRGGKRVFLSTGLGTDQGPHIPFRFASSTQTVTFSIPTTR